MEKLFWEIAVWNSTKKLKQFLVPYGKIAEGKLEELLRVLTAKYALKAEEIVPCFQKRKTKGYSILLEVQRSYKPIGYSCGTNPHCYARVIKVNTSKTPSNKLSEPTP